MSYLLLHFKRNNICMLNLPHTKGSNLLIPKYIVKRNVHVKSVAHWPCKPYTGLIVIVPSSHKIVEIQFMHSNNLILPGVY